MLLYLGVAYFFKTIKVIFESKLIPMPDFDNFSVYSNFSYT